MSVLSGVEPRSVFQFFEEICGIPHGSGNTKGISNYLVAFAKDRNLRFRQDESNNVIIWKDASSGYEDAPIVMLQGHMDMVCEKDPDCALDMTQAPLDLFVDGDMIGAKGTTLGGDDGIAVAMCLAILDSDEVAHGPLECVFTVDEEIGMLGAAALDTSDLKASYLLNLDSEVEGILTVGCAGSTRIVSTFPIHRESFSGTAGLLKVSGLLGGHSGMEIQNGRANSNVLLGRALYMLSQGCDLRIVHLAGGTKDNAIPRDAEAVISVSDISEAMAVVDTLNAALKKEYRSSDPDVQISFQTKLCSDLPMDKTSTDRVVAFLFCAPNGVQMMSSDMPGLVQTSLNLGRVSSDETSFSCRFMVRSSIDSQKKEIVDKVCALTHALGGSVELPTTSPAWEYRPESKLRDTVVDAYRRVYGKDPQLAAMHGGLECGVLSAKIPQLDCISYGPDLTDIHTPAERLHIASAQRVWKLTLEVLKALK